MLNEINALARMGRTEEVSGFVIHLGKLLRRSIAFKDDFVKLSDDLVFVEDYTYGSSKYAMTSSLTWISGWTARSWTA